MIVIGAKGFAKELLEILISNKYGLNETNLFFFDNVNNDLPDRLYDKFQLLRSFDEVKEVIKNGVNAFCFGIGNSYDRKKLEEKFISLGGVLESIVSSKISLGSFGTEIGQGSTIMGNAQITNNVKIGRGCLIYMNTSTTHDVTLGDYVEVGPGVTIAGNCNIGNFTSLGAGCIILPNIQIGSSCIIGAGSVITKDVPSNSMVVGIPGKVIKTL